MNSCRHFQYRGLPVGRTLLWLAVSPSNLFLLFLSLVELAYGSRSGLLITLLPVTFAVGQTVVGLGISAAEVEVDGDALTWKAPARSVTVPTASVRTVRSDYWGTHLVLDGGRKLRFVAWRPGVAEFGNALQGKLPHLEISITRHGWLLNGGSGFREES